MIQQRQQITRTISQKKKKSLTKNTAHTLEYFAPSRNKLLILKSRFYNIIRILYYILLADRGLLTALQKFLKKIIEARVYRHVVYENAPTACHSHFLSADAIFHHKRI